MHSNLLSLDARAVRRASIALIGAALLAACDSDRVASPVPVGPSTKAPGAASSAVIGSNKGNLIIKAYGFNWQSALLPGASYKLIGPGLVTATVTDDGPGDNGVFPGAVTLWDIPIGN